jgi:hypothetical protein
MQQAIRANRGRTTDVGARSSSGTVGRRAKDRLDQDRKRDTGVVESQRRKHEAAMDTMRRLRALRLAKEASEKIALKEVDSDRVPEKPIKTRKSVAGS